MAEQADASVSKTDARKGVGVRLPLSARRRTGSAGDVRIAQIIDRVRGIPKGSVQTYGDIDPKAPRLVGRVLRLTRADIPWHRVVRADGTVAKGARQLDLLRREGVPLRGERVDLSRARHLGHTEARGL